jgi:hypothetical protein
MCKHFLVFISNSHMLHTVYLKERSLIPNVLIDHTVLFTGADHEYDTAPLYIVGNRRPLNTFFAVQDISPSNLMVRVGEYHVLNRNEAHPHLDRRIREVIC